MRITILFGGTNKERLVSVASGQALHQALPEAELWFWDVADTVHDVQSKELLNHARPFEDEFKPDRRGIGLEQALDRAKAEDRLLVLGLHGGRAEDGELQAMCEMRGIPFTGSGSASSHLAFDKVAAKRFAAIAGVKAPNGIAVEDIEAALAEYGKLIAKPARDGSSYGLIFVNAQQDLVAVRNAGRTARFRRFRQSRLSRRRAASASTTGPNIWPNRRRKFAPGALRLKSPRNSWIRHSRRTKRYRAVAIPVRTSLFPRGGRFISKPTRCRV